MTIFLSLVTSIKDYVEVVHKLVETNSSNGLSSYYDLGGSLTFLSLILKEQFLNFLSFKWIGDNWSISPLIPDIASSMISEVSIFDGILKDSLLLQDKPLSYGNENFWICCLEKFIIGITNSVFLCLATSTSSIITLRRFVMQGIEAGYIAGLGSILGNIVWIFSIIFGLRFLVIPWLSLDILRYILGFILLVKYMWDSYSERGEIRTDFSKRKIFVLNFVLAFTEQTTLFPFFTNFSLGSDSTILENFFSNSNNFFEFLLIHGFYLLGLLLGSLSLLQFTCWFLENPAYNFYLWVIPNVKTKEISKFFHFLFLYLTMISTVNSIGYFGLDYTIVNPLGFVHEDRLIEQKLLLETSFLNSKASDRNTRRNRGRHGRRERWKRRVRSYRSFDASLYDQGVYDLFPIEDLNYGFDRFWLRRKIRNHRVRFRFFPGPWMRSLKKEFARPRLESFMGPRVEFFRILFEQTYDPKFHELQKKNSLASGSRVNFNKVQHSDSQKRNFSIYSLSQNRTSKNSLTSVNSFLSKFLRKIDKRLKFKKILSLDSPETIILSSKNMLKNFYIPYKEILKKPLNNFLIFKQNKDQSIESKLYSLNLKLIQNKFLEEKSFKFEENLLQNLSKNLFHSDILGSQKKFSKSDQFMTEYKNFLKTPLVSRNNLVTQAIVLLHPLKFYIQKHQALKKKFAFYGVKQYRTYSVENNAPYFRVMMKRFFYHYKPTLRWERTMRVATMRKARRKGSRVLRKSNLLKKTGPASLLYKEAKTDQKKLDEKSHTINFKLENNFLNKSNIQKPTHFYSLVSKKASRYRYQIYKDVLQHWYYNKMNRLLLKFDVDAFIKRQPKFHNLSSREETLLHIKRFLIFDYYNSKLLYNSMQHYNVMKTTIGKTKTLANRAYNQQFFGNFHKIRHLFSVTPSENYRVLKFDQPLYNEFSNSSDSLIHEEFKVSFINNNNNSNNPNLSLSNLSSAKTFLESENLNKTLSDQKKIQNFLLEKNYKDLTKFLFNENKNFSDFSQKTNQINIIDFWFALFKKCQTKVYDQKALKNFVLSKVEKNEKQDLMVEKKMKIQLDKFLSFYVKKPSTIPSSSLRLYRRTTHIKAIKEAIQLAPRNKVKKLKLKLNKIYNIDLMKLHLNKKEFLKTKILKDNNKFKKFDKLYFFKSLKPNLLRFFEKIKIKKSSYKAQKKNRSIDSLTPSISKSGGLYSRLGLLSKERKNFKSWLSKESIVSKRKKMRKTLKRLKNVQNFSFSENGSFNSIKSEFSRNALYNSLERNADFNRIASRQKQETRKKLDFHFSKSFDSFIIDTLPFPQNCKKNPDYCSKKESEISFNKKNWVEYNKNFFIEWKKRRSRIRRYKFFKGRGPIRKTINKRKKSNRLENASVLYRKESLNFEIQPIKEGKTLIKKHRYWKKHKKPTLAQNKGKLRKRRRYLKAKIRVLTKKFKTIEFQFFFKKWWWSLCTYKKGNTLSLNDSVLYNSTLQSRMNKEQQSLKTMQTNDSLLLENFPVKEIYKTLAKKPIENHLIEPSKPKATVHQLMENLFSSNLKNPNFPSLSLDNLPFYAGWDENTRKFVVTYRLLSRKNAGYFYDASPFFQNYNNTVQSLYKSDSIIKPKNPMKFSNSYLNSMNAATTLYWQIPFTTYDPDQFFALGMDGFSPIGWKNFNFQFSNSINSQLRPILVQKMSVLPNKSMKFSKNLEMKIFEFQNKKIQSLLKSENSKYQKFNQILYNRRIQKPYKRVKKHPRPPVWFPSGPLTSQILPVHYIYVFYKRYGLPRDRYVRRRFRSIKSESFTRIKDHFQIYDYTLRKRVKPKRKYHRKTLSTVTSLYKEENFLQKILRRPFRGYFNEKIRFRPSSSFVLKPSTKIKARKKTEKKLQNSNSRESRENIRLRQLRRRIQRQVFRPVWRYKPQAGGFVWHYGDYLRLDFIKAPKLGTTEKMAITRKIRKKKRRIIPEWQIQPKKYLLEKHNKKVLKKRLEKSQNKF